MRLRRGPGPEDHELFSPRALPRLREATAHLSWLLSRGYAEPSALKLVGDRLQLHGRQRDAVRRAACSDQALARRQRHHEALGGGSEVLVDAFNVLTTLEVACGGGVVLRCRDRAHRDLAGVHGTWRHVADTARVLAAVGALGARRGLRLEWLIDRPVSNSGRLRQELLDTALRHGFAWTAHVVADPDPLLRAASAPVASSDGHVLDGCEGWVDLVGPMLEALVPGAWVLDLGDDATYV